VSGENEEVGGKQRLVASLAADHADMLPYNAVGQRREGLLAFSQVAAVGWLPRKRDRDPARDVAHNSLGTAGDHTRDANNGLGTTLRLSASSDAEHMEEAAVDEIYPRAYRTMADVIAHLPHFLGQVYNNNRQHSALNYRSPNALEADHALTL
jgi:hypothetical protein